MRESVTSIRLLTDAAVNDPRLDFLKFDRYVDPLLEILTDPVVQTPLTIGIFGVWGSGKSTVLSLLEERLSHETQRFLCVQFNAWLHRKEANMLVPLIHALHDTLDKDPQKRFVDSAKKLHEVLLRLSADFLLKTFTLDKVDVEQLEEIERAYVKEKGKVESEMRKLHSVLQAEADAIAANDTRLVFFIDDLDRCEPDQIIDLFDSIKLFLDLRNAFFLIAADKEIIDRGVEVRYGKFRFSDSSRVSAIGAEYLEKMVQVPFQLLPLFPDQIAGYVSSLTTRFHSSQREFLSKVVVPNPRKVKRILNAFALMEHLAKGAGLNENVLLRLIVMQIQSGEIYWQAAKEPKLLLALEQTYAGVLRTSRDQDFEQFGVLSGVVHSFCASYYRPESYLAQVFKDMPFRAVADTLHDYFAMVGH
jgi:hypothetical protein